MKRTLFISGIDTDAGKSYATGWLARRFIEAGYSVATQKFVQTGNTGRSEDIDVHRAIMATGFLPEDEDGTTAPVIFSYPCSPQLAARIDGRTIDLDAIDRSRRVLAGRYDVVLIEGAGGLMVPLTDEFLTIDYPASRGLEVALVTNGKLGSISHTLLALEALRSRGIEVAYLLYNAYFDTDAVIVADTRAFLSRYVARHFPSAEILTVPAIDTASVNNL